MQCVEVIDMPGPAPGFPGTGTQAFYANNVPSSQIIPCSLFFDAGDWIGVLGACGTATMHNSYGTAGVFQSSILGQPVALTRLRIQTNLHTSGGNYLSAVQQLMLGTGRLPLRLASQAFDRPVIGQVFDAEIQEIPGNAVSGALLLGLTQLQPGVDLTGIGMPGCSLYLSPIGLLPYVAGGTATTVLPITIPNQIALAGAHVYAQATAIAPGATPLSVVASNGGDLLLDIQ